jgi:hypothetical protein
MPTRPNHRHYIGCGPIQYFRLIGDGRPLLVTLIVVLLATSAQGASYVDVDSVVIDPIQIRSEFGGGNHPYTGPNLQPSATIAAACSAGQNLSQADLFRADLRDTDLSGCDLSDANLTGADLTGANLAGADLTGADLTGVVSGDLGFWRAQPPITTTADGAVSVYTGDLGGSRDGTGRRSG